MSQLRHTRFPIVPGPVSFPYAPAIGGAGVPSQNAWRRLRIADAVATGDPNNVLNSALVDTAQGIAVDLDSAAGQQALPQDGGWASFVSVDTTTLQLWQMLQDSHWLLSHTIRALTSHLTLNGTGAIMWVGMCEQADLTTATQICGVGWHYRTGGTLDRKRLHAYHFDAGASTETTADDDPNNRIGVHATHTRIAAGLQRTVALSVLSNGNSGANAADTSRALQMGTTPHWFVSFGWADTPIADVAFESAPYALTFSNFPGNLLPSS